MPEVRLGSAKPAPLQVALLRLHSVSCCATCQQAMIATNSSSCWRGAEVVQMLETMQA